MRRQNYLVLFRHCPKLLPTLQLYYHDLFNISYSAYTHYIWDLRTLCIKSLWFRILLPSYVPSLRIVTETGLQPGSMDKVNSSVVSAFVLLGLSSSQELQLFFFVFFSVLYVVIVLGNLLIIVTATSDNSLHSPMYFLLGNCSFVDICQASFATPKMIADFLSEH